MEPSLAQTLFGSQGKEEALRALSNLEHLIDVAKGEAPADLLLTNTVVANVFSGELHEANIAIADGLIAGVGPWYKEARTMKNLGGQYSLPGLIDAHVHLESTMVSVSEYARTVVPRGTTGIIADPHEIANVLGVEGIQYILDAGRHLPLDIFVMVPSAVPATHLETSGATIGPREVSSLLEVPRILGLAELMNFPGVLFKDPSVLWKVLVTRSMRKVIDGHAPLLEGPSLNAYLGIGIGSEHECTRLEEAQEKLRAGAGIILREGSAAKNLKDLLPLVTDHNHSRIMLGTDDRHPEDLLTEGHMDNILRKAVGLGIDPVRAIEMATINAARHYGLERTGAIAPGFAADITVMKDLENFEASLVIKSGTIVAEEGEFLPDVVSVPPPASNTINIGAFAAHMLSLPDPGGEVRVIRLIPDQIITGQFRARPRTQSGMIVSDTQRDILKIAVVERHKASGNVGIGLVNGFGLQRGALASSYAHDSHNIVVVGCSDEDMAQAVGALTAMGGGLVAVGEGKVMASLPLPIAGILSDLGIQEVTHALKNLHEAARCLGSPLPGPFSTLSFLALPVIPELKITDRGLVDVNRFEVVTLGS